MCCAQVGEDAHVMLNGFGTVINALSKRAKPYLPQVLGLRGLYVLHEFYGIGAHFSAGR